MLSPCHKIICCQVHALLLGKPMLQSTYCKRLILSRRIGKWAYALTEYDLDYEHFKSIKGQFVLDFIVNHHVYVGYEVHTVKITSWRLSFLANLIKGRDRCTFNIAQMVVFTKHMLLGQLLL